MQKKIETLQDFLEELKRPKDKRSWIDKKTYKKFMKLYRMSAEVLQAKRESAKLESAQGRSRHYKRW